VSLLLYYNGNWRSLFQMIACLGLGLFFLIMFFFKKKTTHQESQLVMSQSKHFVSSTLKQLLQNKRAWIVAVYSASIYVPLSIMGAIWGASYLQAHALSQVASAEIVSISWLGYALGCVALGLYSDKVRRRKSTMIFCSVI